jgi:acetyl-CoA carboxylase, biotin carboxylase subunit
LAGKPIRKVLVANRGEIALRVIRACDDLGIETVLAMSDADRGSLPAKTATRCVCIGPSPSAQSYLNIKALVMAAVATGCDALHPGYGFLAESEDLAAACEKEGIVFIGPRPDQIRDMGNKLHARALARKFEVPVLEGSEHVRSADEALAVAGRVGLPVMLKAAAGGGGRGMKIVADLKELPALFAAAAAEARAAFGDDTLYLERYLANARHIEVQVLGDRFGNVVHLGERDCSLQRRHQKLVEESPAPGIAPATRNKLCEAALRIAKGMRYENAGTVEFIYDPDRGSFYFLEMNTRIQVEHPVSELVTGIDIVQEQLRVASGERLPFSQHDIVFRGHAIECRVNAESPHLNFRPSPGLLLEWSPPQGPNIRVDSHCFPGYAVPPFYDSLLAKLIVYGRDRDEAVRRMQSSIARFRVQGVDTTLPFLKHIFDEGHFARGEVNTTLAQRLISQMTETVHHG